MERFSSIEEARVIICKRCIYDERVPGIVFDENGICNYCAQVENLKQEYSTGTKQGEKKLSLIISEIKNAGKGKKYDCVIGVSGGTDSSYLLHLAILWGLRPLAVHYDNTWNSAIATQNIRRMLSSLNVDLFTHVVDNKESDDIFRSFFFAGVPEIDAATDLALAETMYRVANKYKIKYLLEGHSFITEGITPVGKNYFDGKYIQNIHKKFGKYTLRSYPLMTFNRFLYWTLFCRIKKIRPFWYIAYSKEEARKLLEKEYGWEYYGGHHLENRITSFAHSIYLPKKFGADLRNNTLSCLVRNGSLSREEAWRIYNTPPVVEDDIEKYFMKRLQISQENYFEIMSDHPKFWYQYKTYKKRFERFRPLFGMLAKKNLVPMSFYLKYCFPVKES